MTRPAPEPFALSFARLAGETAESFHFNKSLGQIFGLLYVSDNPLSLSDICARLGMSKGNASINLRLLESWGAVRPQSVMGSRRDYYEAHRDLKGLALRRLREGVSKRLDTVEERVRELGRPSHGAPASPMEIKRLREMQTLLTRGRRALAFLTKWMA